MPDDLRIRLTHDEALVLSDWLYEAMGTDPFDTLVNRDRAVWAPLHAIAGQLDKGLTGIFSPDYAAELHAARKRLLDQLGAPGRPLSSSPAAERGSKPHDS